MLQVRPASTRGHANHGWLDSRHTFSFGDYFDPEHIGFGALRVINEDRVRAGAGFATHGHKDMEIVSYVLEGTLAHKDSLGNGSVIRPGDVQRMTAGTGVQHSEFNHSATEPVHFLQIWIEPAQKHLPPSYQQKHFDDAALSGRLCLIASADERDGSVLLHQDAAIYATRLRTGEVVSHTLPSWRRAYIHIARGAIQLNGKTLTAGDGVSISQESEIALSTTTSGEALLFDLA